MNTILEKIVNKTRDDLAIRKKNIPAHNFTSFADYSRPRRDFSSSLKSGSEITIIAEIKKASPSMGIIREDFNPTSLAQSYTRNGASAISVLTDEPFFQGSLKYLRDVSEVSRLPILRKDFILDPYQMLEARAWGADAVLLIVKILGGEQLYELHHAAIESGLQVLVECYDIADWERIDFDRISIVGVNNRNLDTFEVDLHRGIELLARAPEGVIRVSESGIHKPEDLMLLSDNGIHSALIGEHFMRSQDPGYELSRFIDMTK